MNNSYKLFRPLALYLPGLTATLLAAGCSLIPTYERPAAPVAAQWPSAITAANSEKASTQPIQNMGWKDFYADATLQELISTALANNRDLRVSVLNIEQARAQLGLRRAAQFPVVNAALTGSRAADGNGGFSNSYSAGLAVTSYEFDFFGRVASLKEQALAQYLATEEGSQTARISLIASVAQGWLNLLADEELLNVSRETVGTREESLKLMDLKLQYGAASELDQRLAQSLLESARGTLAQQQRQRAQDENALVLLLGQALPANARGQLASTQLSATQFADVPAGLPSDLLTRRPDIRQAEQQLIASNANIGAARAAFFPNITLTAAFGSGSSELSGLFKSGSWGWTAAPQLLLPIFDAGRNQSNLEAAQAARDIAVAQYEKAIQSAFREVADALAGEATLSQQLQASQALLAAERERTRLTKLRFDNGAASQLDWLDAQRTLFAAQQALVQTRLAFLQNRIALFKGLGGGLSDTASAPPAAP
ncbi:efflux transporter outer membrane subunit [Rhodoferax sp.]|uniref:efflux transporter outer membrane subunit n=1 Tax=Rhodoferax sp. TaxID=50421 RepID=UPI00283DDF9C|nr:efflux transporter outer membrane subunit [Rhodoferax sp.]MDR3370792.1 efflux transporter outer membrane subunit [Rhodoferax sp.]